MPKPICCLEPLTAFKAFCAQLLFLLLQHFKNGVWMKAKIKSMQVRELIVNFKAGKSNPQFLYLLHDSLIHIPLVSWIPRKHRKHSWEVSLSDLLIIAEWGDRGLTPSNPIIISSATPAAVKVSTYLQRTTPPPLPAPLAVGECGVEVGRCWKCQSSSNRLLSRTEGASSLGCWAGAQNTTAAGDRPVVAE